MDFQTLLDAVGDAILVFSPNGTIILNNSAAVQVLGYLLYERYQSTGTMQLTGLKLTDLMKLRDQADKSVDPVATVMKNKFPDVREDLSFALKNKDKTRLYTNVTPVFDEAENVSSVIMLFRDITEEKELQEKQEEFISVVSHELRTPVAAVEGMLSTALLPKFASLDARAKKYINSAYDNTLFLSRMIQSFTALRKAEMKKTLAKDIETFHPYDLLESVAKDLSKKALEKGLPLKLAKTDSQIPKLVCDKMQLKEVLINIVENAIKYTQKGTIQLSVNYRAKDALLDIEVADTGVGMSAATIQKLFTKFYRAEDYRTRTTRGTGLGLYISKRIMDHLGGNILIESQLDVGSRVHVLVPIKAAVIT